MCKTREGVRGDSFVLTSTEYCRNNIRVEEVKSRFGTRQILRIYILLDLCADSYHYILEVTPL